MNKFEKALDRIKKRVEPSDDWTEDDIEHYKTVWEALEKQIPKKPIRKNPICYEKSKDGEERYAYDYYCPQCGVTVNHEKHHCPCGQALD